MRTEDKSLLYNEVVDGVQRKFSTCKGTESIMRWSAWSLFDDGQIHVKNEDKHGKSEASDFCGRVK